MFFQKIQSKVMDWQMARESVRHWKKLGEQVVFTNGCFDILHFGHIHYLAAAKDLGHRLIIGVNTDESVRKLKGPSRPIKDEKTRMLLLASLACVDCVVLFNEDTPLQLIKNLKPDVLVKGGDWAPDQIVGAAIVKEYGGEVLSLPFVEGYSTTLYEEKIKGNK